MINKNRLTHIESKVTFITETGTFYSVVFEGIHGNLSAKVYRNDMYKCTYYMGSCHANKTSAKRIITEYINN